MRLHVFEILFHDYPDAALNPRNYDLHSFSLDCDCKYAVSIRQQEKEMSDALVRLAKDAAGNPPEITIEDFKAIDLDARKEISSCTPEEIIDRIHACQRIVNTQRIRLAAFTNTIIDWHERATAEERRRIAEHDRKYQVQTVMETDLKKSTASVPLTPEQKMLKRLIASGFTEEQAQTFLKQAKG